MSVANVAPGSAGTWSVFSGGTAVPGTAVTDINYGANWNMTGTTQIKSTLQVDGDATIDGDLKVKGQSITEALDRINERLGILVPNSQLEEDWEELHRLRMQYVELERRLLEQQRTFDILKRP